MEPKKLMMIKAKPPKLEIRSNGVYALLKCKVSNSDSKKCSDMKICEFSGFDGYFAS